MSMRADATAASRAALFAYELSDFLRIVTAVRRRGIVAFDRRIWASFWREDGDKALTQSRAWERWKEKVAGLGIGHATGTELFEISEPAALAWIEQAIRRGNELAKAYEQVTGRTPEVLRAPKLEIERNLTAAEVADRLGVRARAVCKWAAAGAPHDRVKKGDFAFSEPELRAWLADRMDTSRRMASHHETRVPVTDASRILASARDTYGLTTDEFARRLGVPASALWKWLRREVETVPASVVAEAEVMLAERGIRPEEAKPTGHEPRIPQPEAASRLRAVREALNMSSAVLAQALGVPTVTLKSWLGTGGKIAETVPVWAVEGAEGLLETTERRISRFSSAKLTDPETVRKAFAEAHGSAARAAEILGVAKTSAFLAARKLGIETAKRVDLTEVVSGEDLRSALERHGGNAARAAEDLGIDRPSVLRLAERYGFGELPRRRAPPIVVEREKLEEAVLRLGSVRAAANELGLSAMTALRLARRYGITS